MERSLGTYAAFILLRFAGGWPSLLTNRICFGGGTTEAGVIPPEEIELMARWQRQTRAFVTV